MSYLHKIQAATMKIRVIVTEKKTGNTITVMDGDEFMKAVKAPITQFLADSIKEYNDAHPDLDAKMEILVSKRGKWQSLGGNAIHALVTTLTTTLGNKRYLKDLETLLQRLEPLSPHEEETIYYLIRDLK